MRQLSKALSPQLFRDFWGDYAQVNALDVVSRPPKMKLMTVSFTSVSVICSPVCGPLAAMIVPVDFGWPFLAADDKVLAALWQPEYRRSAIWLALRLRSVSPPFLEPVSVVRTR
jgi:hypothetical protein